MNLSPYSAMLFVAGLLTGIAVMLLVSLASELPQAINDLRGRRASSFDNFAELAIERVVSRRFYRTLYILAGVVALIFLPVFLFI